MEVAMIGDMQIWEEDKSIDFMYKNCKEKLMICKNKIEDCLKLLWGKSKTHLIIDNKLIFILNYAMYLKYIYIYTYLSKIFLNFIKTI